MQILLEHADQVKDFLESIFDPRIRALMEVGLFPRSFSLPFCTSISRVMCYIAIRSAFSSSFFLCVNCFLSFSLYFLFFSF